MPSKEGLSEASKTALSGSLPFKPPALPGVPDFTVPAVKDLRALNCLIEKFQNVEHIVEADFLILLNSGSSLCGSRPKLSVIDNDNSLWMAKFPSIHDTYDIPAREAISFYLAECCQIKIPAYKLMRLTENKSILLVKRFDRNNDRRIPYLSAKTFLQANDGQSNNYSYLDIAQIIESNSY